MTSADDTPMLDIRVQTIVCARHGEVFRAAWPAGYLTFGLEALKHVLENDEEIAAAADGKAEHLDAVLAEFGPLCGRLDRDVRRRLYKLAAATPDFGCYGLCACCRKWKLGAPYSASGPKGIVHAHMAFDCLAKVECGS